MLTCRATRASLSSFFLLRRREWQLPSSLNERKAEWSTEFFDQCNECHQKQGSLFKQAGLAQREFTNPDLVCPREGREGREAYGGIGSILRATWKMRQVGVHRKLGEPTTVNAERRRIHRTLTVLGGISGAGGETIQAS